MVDKEGLVWEIRRAWCGGCGGLGVVDVEGLVWETNRNEIRTMRRCSYSLEEKRFRMFFCNQFVV